MKKRQNFFVIFHMIRFWTLLLVIIVLGANARAIASPNRATATGHATATVVTPLRVEGISQLDFGYLLPGSRQGQVTITPTARRQIDGRVSMLPGIYMPATFNVTGMPNVYYTVMTPTTLVFRTQNFVFDLFGIDVDKSSLLVKDFTTFSRNLGGGDHRGFLGKRGKDTLSVGGTLVVPPSAAPGRYRGIVPISVAYQ